MNKAKHSSVNRFSSFVAVFLFTSVYFSGNSAVAETPPELHPNPKAEQWVAEQVRDGNIADLEGRFPKDENKRILSSRFLEDLLTSSPNDGKVHRKGVRIENAVFIEPIDLRNAEVPHVTWLDDCRFENSVDLTYSHFHRNLSFIGSVLKKQANFNRMKVGMSAFFRRANFAGPVDFRHADITGNFVADEAQFTNEEKEAIFNSMKVGHTALFRKAVFSGAVNFGSADISSQFVAEEAQLRKEAIFNHLKVGQVASFSEAVFEGKANFNSMKVGHTSFFRKAVFSGAVDFGSSDISSQFVAHEAQFTNEEKEANFNHMKVGDIAFFNKANFAGSVFMSDASFSRLDLTDVNWPDGLGSVGLEGMTYKHIDAGDKIGSCHNLLDLASSANYSASVYENLENFFQRQGYPEQADEVYVAKKRREREEGELGFLRKLWSWVLDFSVRYGREPGRAFIFSAIIVAIGCVIFRDREKMGPDSTPRHYSAFWYSLDVFVPLVNLQTADVWIPKQDRRFARNYMRIHRILGWVLIPIGLAAWTGIIK